jgi:serine/threonine protein kinase
MVAETRVGSSLCFATTFSLASRSTPLKMTFAASLENRCPKCGHAIPDSAMFGLCPACVVSIAVDEAVALASGLRVGDYELKEEIGRGSTGVVWRAKHVKLHRHVALKMLRTGTFSTKEAKKHLEREVPVVLFPKP